MTTTWSPIDLQVADLAFSFEVLYAIRDERMEHKPDPHDRNCWVWAYNDGDPDGTAAADLFDGTAVVDEVFDFHKQGYVDWDGNLPRITDAGVEFIKLVEGMDIDSALERCGIPDLRAAARDFLDKAVFCANKKASSAAWAEVHAEDVRWFTAVATALAYRAAEVDD